MDVKINTHGNPMPEVHGEWVDLATAEDAELGFLDFKIISLGISMELPEGYYAEIVPRSSTFKKWGVLLANSMGVIENDYCGDGDVWGFPAICLRKEGTKIPAGTRVCQFRLVEKAPEIKFTPVLSLGHENRGGFGSTGTGVNHKPAPVSRTERMFGKRETWNTQEENPDKGQGPYRGFMIIRCESCGAVKAYCARRDTYSYKCPCGHETPLENLRPMYMHCKCGSDFRYKTNLQDATFTHECMDCKAPVDMELNSRETAYVTAGERRNGNGNKQR